MRQALRLDRLDGLPYHALGVGGLVAALMGCAHSLRSIAPVDLLPASPDTIGAWSADFRPLVPLKYQLRWRFENSLGASAGRAVVRYAPPDTLRFDFRAPLGRSGSAVIVRGEPVWAEPAGDFEDLVPVAPILWAALGIVMTPADSATLMGRDEPGWRAWRYVQGEEAIDFIYQRGPSPRLQAEVRHGERVAGVVAVDLAPTNPWPTRAVMRFAGGGSLTFTVQARDSVAAFPPDTWQRS
jgi:hypothetical protein